MSALAIVTPTDAQLDYIASICEDRGTLLYVDGNVSIEVEAENEERAAALALEHVAVGDFVEVEAVHVMTAEARETSDTHVDEVVADAD